MKNLYQILSKSFALFLILLIPLSYNGVLVFKHICNSTSTVKLYFFVNEKCNNESSDICCSEEKLNEFEDLCCDDLGYNCEGKKHFSEDLIFIENTKCCFDETNVFSVKEQIISQEKYNPTTYRTFFYLIHDENISVDIKNQFLSNSDNFAFSPPNLKIISFIHNHSQDKSSDSHLS